MEGDIASMISDVVENGTTEASDSNNSTHAFFACREVRNGNDNSTIKFKGVVPQQNGNWGAQIYAKHQRIWLGTFKSEREAAMAYDSAAIKLRSGDSHRNFPWTNITVEEPHFQDLYSTGAVLNMIKDGSYQLEFSKFLGARSQNSETNIGPNLPMMQKNGGLSCKQLFQKELTPSDVGKLNRLVIPKKYAIKYFPQVFESVEENAAGGLGEDTQLVFYDRMMRSWKFRFCYWKSSQSFVFTRGWSRFVKEKKLKANDTITFYLCESRERAKEVRTFCMIDHWRAEDGDGGLAEGADQHGLQLEWKLEISHDACENKHPEMETDQAIEVEEYKTEEKGFKLFGVVIN